MLAGSFGDLIKRGVEVIEIVVGTDELLCSLFADAVDTGNMVGGVAHKRHVIDDLFGGNAVFLDHFVATNDHAAFVVLCGVVELDALRDELCKVFVA